MTLLRAAVLLCGAVAAACGPERSASSSAAQHADDAADARAVCLDGDGFTAEGPVPVATTPASAAVRVTALRWQAHDGCDRVVIDLAGSDVAGAVRAEVLRPLGVVRVHLGSAVPDDAVDAAATEARFGGELAHSAYTVRGFDGSLFVDIHLAAAAEARVLVLREPARVVVDLRPGGAALPAPAAAGERVVVLAPRSGAVESPLEVSGYARTFEANVVARLERAGVQLTEQFTTAAGWLETWGFFSLTLPAVGRGPVTLHVGEHSAKDGVWQGVRLELDVR